MYTKVVLDPKKEAVIKKSLALVRKNYSGGVMLPGSEPEDFEKIPISIFNTSLSPLQAVTRYLRERHKKTHQIAKLLRKRASSISEAYMDSVSKDFNVAKTDVYIPLSVFQENPQLSILEVVVWYLRKQNFGFTQAALLMGKSPKTIWTVNQRAIKKND